MRFRNCRQFMIVLLGLMLALTMCLASVSAGDPVEIIAMTVYVDARLIRPASFILLF